LKTEDELESITPYYVQNITRMQQTMVSAQLEKSCLRTAMLTAPHTENADGTTPSVGSATVITRSTASTTTTTTTLVPNAQLITKGRINFAKLVGPMIGALIAFVLVMVLNGRKRRKLLSTEGGVEDDDLLYSTELDVPLNQSSSLFDGGAEHFVAQLEATETSPNAPSVTSLAPIVPSETCSNLLGMNFHNSDPNPGLFDSKTDSVDSFAAPIVQPETWTSLLDLNPIVIKEHFDEYAFTSDISTTDAKGFYPPLQTLERTGTNDPHSLTQHDLDCMNDFIHESLALTGGHIQYDHVRGSSSSCSPYQNSSTTCGSSRTNTTSDTTSVTDGSIGSAASGQPLGEHRLKVLGEPSFPFFESEIYDAGGAAPAHRAAKPHYSALGPQPSTQPRKSIGRPRRVEREDDGTRSVKSADGDWSVHVLLLGAKERNHFAVQHKLTQEERLDLKTKSRKHKQKISQRKYHYTCLTKILRKLCRYSCRHW
jgi:hypothetical protein